MCQYTFYFKKQNLLKGSQPAQNSIRQRIHPLCSTLNKKENNMGIKGKNDRMVVLACEDCKERNYTTVKNKKNTKERLELSKYCPTCKKHTNHKETK